MEVINTKKTSKYNKSLDNLSLMIGLSLGFIAFVLMSFMDYYNSYHISADIFHKVLVKTGVEREVTDDDRHGVEQTMNIIINEVNKKKSKEEILGIFNSNEKPNILSDLIENEIGFGTQDNPYRLVITPEIEGGEYNSPQNIKLSTNFVDQANNLVNPSIYHDDVLLYYNNLDAEPDYFLPYKDGFMVEEPVNNVIFYAVHTGGVYTGGAVYNIKDTSNPTIEKAVFNKDNKNLILYFDEIMDKDVSYDGKMLSQILKFSNGSTLQPYSVAKWIDSPRGPSALEVEMGTFSGSDTVLYTGGGPFSPITDLFDNPVIQEKEISIDVESIYIPVVKVKYLNGSEKLPLYLNFETYFENQNGVMVTSEQYNSEIDVMRKVMPVNEFDEDVVYNTYDNWVFNDSLLMYYAVDLRTGIRSEINTKLYYNEEINPETNVENYISQLDRIIETNRSANQFILDGKDISHIDMLWSHEKYILHMLRKSKDLMARYGNELKGTDKLSKDKVLDKWYEYRYSIENILDVMDEKVQRKEGIETDLDKYFEMMYERTMDSLDDSSVLLEKKLNIELTKYDVDYIFTSIIAFGESIKNIKTGLAVTANIMGKQDLEDIADDLRDSIDIFMSEMDNGKVAYVNITDAQNIEIKDKLDFISTDIQSILDLIKENLETEDQDLLDYAKYLRDDVIKFERDKEEMLSSMKGVDSDKDDESIIEDLNVLLDGAGSTSSDVEDLGISLTSGVVPGSSIE